MLVYHLPPRVVALWFWPALTLTPFLRIGSQKIDLKPAPPIPKGETRVEESRNFPQPSQLRSIYGNTMRLWLLGFQRYSLGASLLRASLLRASPQCPFEKDLGSISLHRCGQCWKAKNEGGRGGALLSAGKKVSHPVRGGCSEREGRLLQHAPQEAQDLSDFPIWRQN